MDAVADRVKETISAATGTPTTSVTLSGAVDASFRTFNNAIGQNRFFYAVAVDGNNWQTMQCHLTTATNLVIDRVFTSSSGSNLTLSTATIIFCDAIAKMFKDLYGAYGKHASDSLAGVSAI